MSNMVWAIVPLSLMVVLYIIIFAGKGELTRIKKSWLKYDWITFLSFIFASIVLSSTMRATGANFPVIPLIITCTVVIGGVIIVALIKRAKTGKPVIQTMGDERTEVIFAKSARNAFFATCTALFIHLFISDTGSLDYNWLLIVITTGLIVLTASLPVYYYRKM